MSPKRMKLTVRATTLLAEKILCRTGEGKKGKPYKYWRPAEDSAETTEDIGSAERKYKPADASVHAQEDSAETRQPAGAWSGHPLTRE